MQRAICTRTLADGDDDADDAGGDGSGSDDDDGSVTDDDDDDDDDVRLGRPNPIRHNSGSNDRDRTAPSCLRGTSDPPAVTQHFISTHWADVKL